MRKRIVAIAAGCALLLLTTLAWADAGSGVLRSANSDSATEVTKIRAGTVAYYRFTAAANSKSFNVTDMAAVCAQSSFNSAVVSIRAELGGTTTAASMLVPITSTQTTLTGTSGEDCAALIPGTYYINVDTTPSSGTSVVKIIGY